jgi:hypothetical protein
VLRYHAFALIYLKTGCLPEVVQYRHDHVNARLDGVYEHGRIIGVEGEPEPGCSVPQRCE